MRPLERQHLGQLFIYLTNNDVPHEDIGPIMWWVSMKIGFVKSDIRRNLQKEEIKDHPYAEIVAKAESSNAFGIRG